MSPEWGNGLFFASQAALLELGAIQSLAELLAHLAAGPASTAEIMPLVTMVRSPCCMEKSIGKSYAL